MKPIRLLLLTAMGLGMLGEVSAADVIRVALLSNSPQSALYKWNDDEGRIHYSDRPPAGIARDYEPSTAQPNATVIQLETPKIAAQYLPLPAVPQAALTTPNQKPNMDLTAHLVWLDRNPVRKVAATRKP